MKKIFTFFWALLIATSFAWADEVTFNFVGWDFDGASSWTTSYAAHDVVYDQATVKFEAANKQNAGLTIDDCPVTKGMPVTVVLNDLASDITAVSATFKQWGSKAQTITLSTSADGTTFEATDNTSATFAFETVQLPASTKAIQFSFSSSNNQVGIASITISTAVGEAPAIVAPVIRLKAGSYYGTQKAAITCVTEGAKIYYTLDGSEPTIASAEYSDAIDIESSCTLKAIAVNGDAVSDVVEATYEIKEIVNITAGDLDDTEVGAVVNFDDSYVLYQCGKYLYTYDFNNTVLIYGDVKQTYSYGDKIPSFQAQVAVYNGEKQLQPLSEFAAADPNDNYGFVLNYYFPSSITLDKVVAGLHNSYVSIANVTISEISGKNFTISDAEGNKVPGYNQFSSAVTLPEEGTYNMVGIINHYKTSSKDTVQILPVSFVTPEVAAVTSITPADGATVSELNHFELTFDKDVTLNTYVFDAMIVDANGETVATANMRNTHMSDGTLVVETTPTVKVAGAYKFVIAPNSLYVGESKTPSTEFSFSYNVDGSMDKLTCEPDFADGATLGKIQNMDFHFSQTITALDTTMVMTIWKGDDIVRDVKTTEVKVFLKTWLQLRLEDAITEAGSYKIVIPAGFLILGEGVTNTETFEFNYTVAAQEAVKLNVTEIDPAEGQVNKIQNITMSFDNPSFAFDESAMDVHVEDANGNIVYQVTADEMGAFRGMLFIYMNEAITENGDYKLVIGEGTFLVGESQSPSARMEFNYTVNFVPTSFTATPATGSTVEQLSEVLIECTEGIGFSWCVFPTLTKDGEEIPFENYEMIDSWSESEPLEATQMKIVLNAPITEAGVYTLTFPAGSFILASTYEDYLEDVSFTWTVSPSTSIQNIAGQEEAATVYTLNGMKANADKLVPGLYIMNGKKVMIRK